MGMIRVVLMDIGNVLVNFDLHKLVASLLDGTGKTPREVLAYLNGSGLGERYEKGLVSTEGFFETLRRELGYTGDFERFKTAWNGIFWENPEGVAVFRALKKKGRVFLASNTNELHYEYLRRQFPFLAEADGEVLSHEIKARKPEADFFHKALRKAGVRPEEAVLIDDTPGNIRSAQALGIFGIHFTGGPAVWQALSGVGLAPFATDFGKNGA
jgi:FMN phosphatase YigB (HAD superfamily)